MMGQVIQKNSDDVSLNCFLSNLLSWNEQVTFANLRRDEIYDAFGGSETKGLSRDVLKKLPSHVIVGDARAAQGFCCTICLQVRTLSRNA